MRGKEVPTVLAILHPVITVAMIATYVSEGRFNPKSDAVVVDMAHAAPPASAEGLAQTRLALHNGGMAP